MKRIGAFILGMLLAAPLFAQETLIDGDVTVGGFGGPALQLTTVNNKLGLLVGGGGGVIIGHVLSIGGAGYGLVNNVGDESAPTTTPYLNLGYGGVYLQYIHNSDQLLHLTGTVLIGGGGVGYRRDTDNNDGSFGEDTMNDAIFVAEPSIDAELNVTRNMRITLGAGYRFVSGVELNGLSNKDFSGPSARLMVKFGAF